MDSRNWSRILSRDRRFEPAPCVTYLAHHSIRISRAKNGSRLLRADVDHAICALRHVHGAEFCALVSVLRNESDTRVPAHQIWGGENRDRAATKFFLYTFLGSVAMLLGFLGIYLARGSFDFATLAGLGKNGLLSGKLAWLAFAGIFLGLAVKVPLFPFHTWLP